MFLLLLGIAFYWSACSCNTEASGVVLDLQTKQVIQGVRVQLSLLHHQRNDTLNQPVVTNAAGFFELRHSYCKNYDLTFFKEGYIMHTATPKTENTVYLSPATNL
ncbi:MAG: hypothetical protein AB8E82_09745 [Aureispira sp.]